MMTPSSTGQRRRSIVGDIYDHHDFQVVTESLSSSSSSPSASSSLLTSTNNVESWIHDYNNNKTDTPSVTLMKNYNLWNSKLLLLPAAVDSFNENWMDVLFEEDDDNGSSINLLTSTMMRFCVDDDDDHQQQQQQQEEDSDEMRRTSKLPLENIIDVAIATIQTYHEQPFGTSSSAVAVIDDHKGKLSVLQNERVVIEKEEKEEEEENNSTCSSTLDDWEEVFGEDGSISENCCDCEQQLLRRLPFTMIETNNTNEEEEGGREEEEDEDYDEVLLNPTTENWDSLFGQDDDDNDKHNKEKCKKSELRSSTKSSDSDINSRNDMLNRSSLMTDESSGGIDDDKDKENPRSSSTYNNTQVSPPPGFTSCEKMESLHVNTNCTVTTKTKTTSINNSTTSNVSNNSITVPTNNIDETEFSKEAQSKQKQQQQQYDSVWDVHFQQGEEENLTTIVVPMNDSGTVVSDTPEDWEALLDEDDDEEIVSGTRSNEVEEEEIPSHDDILVVPVPTNDGVSMVSNTPEDWEALLEDDDDDENEPATRSKEEEILLQDDIIGAQENDIFPSKIAKKRISTPAKNILKRAQSKQQQQQQYDSVWDMTFQEKENLPTTIVSMHDEGTIVSNSFACLEGNPDPSEDWEAMLVDEEESVSGTRSKEIPLRDDIVTTQEVEALRSKIHAIENPLTLTEKKTEKEKTERQDCATTSKKNLRPCWKIESSISYNSVWEMCSKANDEYRVDHNHDRATTSSLSESTTGLMLNPHHCFEPQVEWEDLYS